MKKVLTILGSIAGIIIALLTANRGLIKKQERKIEVLNKKKKDLELKKAVLIDNARDAKKKTIKSEKELADEIKRINKAYGDNVDDIVKFIRTGKR